MMGFGSSGHGGPPSSESNLPPLAPPFTAPLPNARPNSNPLGHITPPHFTQAPPQAFTFRPSHHPPAPIPYLGIDSNGATGPPPASSNGRPYFFGPQPISCPGTHIPSLRPPTATTTPPFRFGQHLNTGASSFVEPEPYFPQYPPAEIHHNSPSVLINKPGVDVSSTSTFPPLERSSQPDNTQTLSGLGSTVPWGGSCNGMSDEEQGIRKDLDDIFCRKDKNVAGYKSSLNQDYGISAPQHHLGGIEPLNESNYAKWKSQIDIVLGHMEYDVALLEPKPDEPEETASESVKAKYQKWIKANHMCILIIRGSIPDTISDGIPKTDSAKELMDTIKTQFLGSTKALVETMISQLCTMKFDGQGSVREHILKMANLVHRLRELKMELPDDFLVHMAINSLADEYNTFKVNYIHIDQKWSVNELIAQCVQEEERLRQGKVDFAHVTSLSARKKDFKKSRQKVLHAGQHSEGKAVEENQENSGNALHDKLIDLGCFFCKEKGHFKKDCPKYNLYLGLRKGVPKPAVA